MTTTLWRINISPAAESDVDPREFCFTKGILGFGWPLEESEGVVEWENYERLATALYYENGDYGWWPAANALHNRMQIGDLVWSRDWNGVYFLGRVAGQWEYTVDLEHRRADIVNYRRCEWYKVGVADKVPGAVRNSFSRGRVLQAIWNDTALSYSKLTFNQCACRTEYADISSEERPDLFSLLSPTDLEDLVGLYLQSIGYSIVPSSCQRTSAAYEFVLRHRKDGRTATAQVKAGGQSLDRDEYTCLPGEVYLFASSENYTGSEHQNVHCIARSTLETFVNESGHILPSTVAIWMRRTL